MNTIIYNSRDEIFKSPFGAIKTDQSVTFTVRLPKSSPQNAVYLKLFPIDNEDQHQRIIMPLLRSDNLIFNEYSCGYSSPIPMLCAYYFEIETYHSVDSIKKGEGSFGLINQGDFWQLTVYDKSMIHPSVLGDGIIYQLFPDRFYNSGTPKEGVPSDRILRLDWGELPLWQPNANGEVLNNDYFGGDLKGIEEKLDYLKALGVTMVYLNPIFESHSSHRYDTANYLSVDPLLGNEDDFKSLCKTAKSKGISIVLDGVFNHTGSDSVYFNRNKRYGDSGAYNDKNSPYFSWYNFRNYPDDYECWWGFDTLPNVNESDKSYVDFICGEHGVLEKWLALGASGYRLDVADELPDSFLDQLNHRVKAVNSNSVIFGEVWEDASNKISYGLRRRYFLGNQLDSVMNYPFKDSILNYIRYGSSENLYETILTVLENYPPPVISSLMNSLSTHDTPRAITALVGEPMENNRNWQVERHYLPIDLYNHGKKLLTLAWVMQFGLPGVPCVYYGDEVGLSGYRDPFNRVCYPWEHQDQDLLSTLTALGQMRVNAPYLSHAKFIPIIFQENHCIFLRKDGENIFFFAVNRTDQNLKLDYPIPENATHIFSSQSSDRNSLSAFGSIIFHWTE